MVLNLVPTGLGLLWAGPRQPKGVFKMKRLLIALALLGASLISANAQSRSSLCYTTNGTNCVLAIQASNSNPIDISTATTTELIALNVDKTIFLTSWDVMAGGTGTIRLVYGSGTACGTGTTNLTGAYPLIAQAGIAKGNGLGIVLAIPKGKALCATTNANVQYSGSVSFVQFQ